MLRTVTVLSTGGTIASTSQTDGAEPSKGGEELVAAVPELTEYADITVKEVVQIPSFDVNPTIIAEVARRRRRS